MVGDDANTARYVAVRLFRDKHRPADASATGWTPGARGPVGGAGGDGRDQTEVMTLTSCLRPLRALLKLVLHLRPLGQALEAPAAGVVSIKWREPASLRIFKWSGGQAGWRQPFA
jgi:hypothetical protein